MSLFSLIRRQMVPLVVLCSFVFFGSQSAQAQYNKLDPGMNNPPPAGAILDLNGTQIPTSAYQQYSVNFIATVPNTAITFAIREDPAFILLSNVSVTDVTAVSATNLLMNGDFSGGTHTEGTNSLVPNSWTYANQYGASAGGVAVAGLGIGGGNCWDDGAVQAYDALSQTISTIVGHIYQITFFVRDTDGGGIFSDVSTNGDTTNTGGNGRNVTVYAQAGLPPPGGQTQTSLPQTFSSTGNTTVTVPFIFNQNQGTYDEQDEEFTQNGDLNCPIGCVVQVQDTATAISNDPVWSTFVGGTPFGPSKLFPHASNGGTDIGTMYTIECFNSANPPKPGQCPFPTSPGPGNHVNAKEIFDLPVALPPTIAFGTTVGGLHYPPGTIAMPNPPWSSSNMLPNPACKNVLTATFDCPLENTAVTKYGKANKIDKDTKNGSYAVAYGVPMLCSAWKVISSATLTALPLTTPLNTQCVQNPSSSVFFAHSPVAFDFLVTPALLPVGFTIQGFNNIVRTGGNTVTITMSAVPTAWTIGTTLAIKPDDTTNFPPVSAVISNVTLTQFSYTQAGSNVTGTPSTGTADDANGFVAAPVDKLFYHIDPCTSTSGDPCSNAPDYPNNVLLTNDENLNDLDNCPGPPADQFGNPCMVAGTSPAQPGTSSTKAVEFTTMPVSATSLPEGLYKLQVAAKDTVNTSEMNIQLLTDPLAQCPDPSPTDANRIPNSPPGQGWLPPCYSTTLFYAKIGVDNTPPTVTPTLSPAPATNNGVLNSYFLNQVVTVTYTCNDPTSGGVASGVATCAPGAPSTLDTSTVGPHSLMVTATDVAGNQGTATVNYTVVDQPDDLDLFYLAPYKIKPGSNLAYFIALVNLAQKNVASGLSVTDVVPQGTTVVSAVFDKVSCSWWGCSIPKTGTPCTISGRMITCNIGSLAPLNTLTGAGIFIVVNVPANTPLGTVLTDKATATGLNRDTDKDNSVTINTTVKNY